jgi:hypothetical protein
VANKAERMKKIRAAKAALEQEAIGKAKEDQDKPTKKAKKKDDDEDPPPPPPPQPEPGFQDVSRIPEGDVERAQRNFTGLESRIMPTKNGFEQCYNAQAGVDAQAQVIVACAVVNTSAAVRSGRPVSRPAYSTTGAPMLRPSPVISYCRSSLLWALPRTLTTAMTRFNRPCSST